MSEHEVIEERDEVQEANGESEQPVAANEERVDEDTDAQY